MNYVICIGHSVNFLINLLLYYFIVWCRTRKNLIPLYYKQEVMVLYEQKLFIEEVDIKTLSCFTNSYVVKYEKKEMMGKKKPPDYGQEAIQMFSQRNNPYCELLSEF